MSRPLSALYKAPLTDVRARISTVINRGCKTSKSSPLVFFRADDIGVPSHQFSLMIDCYKKHSLPLCLATVPAWTNSARVKALLGKTGSGNSQWCWHQHGFTHRNFETAGKKQEFGPCRSSAHVESTLARGKSRLYELLGESFRPIFTPPWNRCSATTLEILQRQGFLAISRNSKATPEAPANLPDYPVNVDLHTRKEPSAEAGFSAFLHELEEGLGSGYCGIMLHHQRMNKAAFHFLDILLEAIANERGITTVHFGNLLDQKRQPPIPGTNHRLFKQYKGSS